LNESQERELLLQLNPDDGKRKAVIVSARMGMGKTTFIKRAVAKLGWELDERDISVYTTDDWEALYALVSVNLGNVVVWIPSIDKAKESRLVKLVKTNHNNAIILETSKMWGLKELRGYCRDISLDMLDWRAMTEIMKGRGTYTGKTPQNLYHAYGDGEFERIESDFSLVAKFFSGECVPVDTKFLPWLIDNAPNYLNGYDLYLFYEFASRLAALGKVDYISGLAVRGTGQPERPYYYKKLGLVRNESD